MSATKISKNSTSREIIAFIHAEAESQRSRAGASDGLESATWDCCTREEQVLPAYAAERKRWADAAYQGDWRTILQVNIRPFCPFKVAILSRCFVTARS